MSAGDLDAAVAAIFAADGPLSRVLPGYRARTQQREMAARVGQAIRERRVLLAAFTQRQRHGQHAEDHGDGSHQHGPQSHAARG